MSKPTWRLFVAPSLPRQQATTGPLQNAYAASVLSSDGWYYYVSSCEAVVSAFPWLVPPALFDD
jgi:hypothetical protein